MSSRNPSVPQRLQDQNTTVSTHRWVGNIKHSLHDGKSIASSSPKSQSPRGSHALPQPEYSVAGPGRVNQPVPPAQSSSSASTLVDPAPQPPRITETSVAAVMRLAGRLRDLDGVMGLWDDFERNCRVTTAFIDMGRYYLDEIYAAVIEVREALGEVQDLADEGLGTEEPGIIEKRAGQIVERVGRWLSEQKRLLQAEGEAGSAAPMGETKEEGKAKSKAQPTKKGANEVKKEKKVAKGKEKEVVYLSEKQAQEVSKNFVKEVRKGLRSGSIEQEEREIAEMRRVLLENIQQASQSKEKLEAKN